MNKTLKKLLKFSIFSNVVLSACFSFAIPIAIPNGSNEVNPENNGLSTIYSKTTSTIIFPPSTTGTISNNGNSGQNTQQQRAVLIYNTTPGAYQKTINLGQFLQADPKATLVVYIAGGQGGWHPLPSTAATVVGGIGGITIFTAPLANFINKFGNNVSFYYVVGGKGSTAGNSAGGGGASMVAVKNWPHDGGITLAIAGGGGGSTFNLAGWGANQTTTMLGGGGGGGNDCGENGITANPIYVNNIPYAYGVPTIFGQGGCQGKGGNSGNAQGGSANPNLIDIAGGGGGSEWGGTNGLWCSGAGGGTGQPGQSCNGSPGSGTNGYGYQNGGNGSFANVYWFGPRFHVGILLNEFGSHNSYSAGSPDGGYGGGGGSSSGSDAGGGGGYGGGGGGWVGSGGGGGGYCASWLGTCQASDWTNGGGNYGNGYVYVYIQP